MNRIRIEFLKDGKAIKSFDRSVHEKAEAARLPIAKDSGIPHDAKIKLERKFEQSSLPDGKPSMIQGPRRSRSASHRCKMGGAHEGRIHGCKNSVSGGVTWKI